jgi:transcriptional regulator with XRE-family HTH domain
MDPVELKLLRIRRRLRQYQVAAAVGIAPCRLSEIETGRREPSPELLGRILKVIEEKESVQSEQPGQQA